MKKDSLKTKSTSPDIELLAFSNAVQSVKEQEAEEHLSRLSHCVLSIVDQKKLGEHLTYWLLLCVGQKGVLKRYGLQSAVFIKEYEKSLCGVSCLYVDEVCIVPKKEVLEQWNARSVTYIKRIWKLAKKILGPGWWDSLRPILLECCAICVGNKTKLMDSNILEKKQWLLKEITQESGSWTDFWSMYYRNPNLQIFCALLNACKSWKCWSKVSALEDNQSTTGAAEEQDGFNFLVHIELHARLLSVREMDIFIFLCDHSLLSKRVGRYSNMFSNYFIYCDMADGLKKEKVCSWWECKGLDWRLKKLKAPIGRSTRL